MKNLIDAEWKQSRVRTKNSVPTNFLSGLSICCRHTHRHMDTDTQTYIHQTHWIHHKNVRQNIESLNGPLYTIHTQFVNRDTPCTTSAMYSNIHFSISVTLNYSHIAEKLQNLYRTQTDPSRHWNVRLWWFINNSFVFYSRNAITWDSVGAQLCFDSVE